MTGCAFSCGNYSTLAASNPTSQSRDSHECAGVLEVVIEFLMSPLVSVPLAE